MSYKKVKNIFWEGDTLVIETEDGKSTKYKGAYIKNVEYEFDENDCVESASIIIKNNKGII